MAATSEAECGALYYNSKIGKPLISPREEINWIQGITQITTYNSTAYGIINKSTQQKQSHAMGMRFYWVQDWYYRDQFNVKWQPGDTNLGDYFIKHQPPSHHKKMSPIDLVNAIHIIRSNIL